MTNHSIPFKYPENVFLYRDEDLETWLSNPGFARTMLHKLKERGVRWESEPPGGFTDEECKQLVRVIYAELHGRENLQ